MRENLQQSLKKIKILENRVESLSKVKKNAEAIVKAKKLFHLSTSFVSNLNYKFHYLFVSF